MLRQKESQQLSFYSALYNKIPEKHVLKKIEKAVDFSFINELLEGSYCKNFGRPAKEPEMMLKLLLLEYLYSLSDVKVIEEAEVNLAFLWFLGLNPEDKLPDPSLLAKFRTQRMKDITLDQVITEIIRQCVVQGIIDSTALTVDTTHTEANCKKSVPERIMKQLAKRIFKGIEEDWGSIPEKIDTNIPDDSGIEDPKAAKQMLQEYLEGVIEEASAMKGLETQKAVAEAREILSDEKFLQQKGVRSLSDKDARVGNKSKTDQFLGYKTEFMMTAKERIITSVAVHSGEYTDGKEFAELLEKTLAGQVQIEELYGDKAYFRKDILDLLQEKGIKDYIPVSASVYKIDEDAFSYNKDSDQWFCRMGNVTISKRTRTRKTSKGKEYDQYVYLFEKEQCLHCPHRDECIGKKKQKAKEFIVAASTPLFYEKNQEQKTPEFQEKYKQRAAQEWKNAEMKRFHGMTRARGWGLRSMSFQAKLTAIAVNLKRIAQLVEDKSSPFDAIFAALSFLLPIPLNSRHFSRITE